MGARKHDIIYADESGHVRFDIRRAHPAAKKLLLPYLCVVVLLALFQYSKQSSNWREVEGTIVGRTAVSRTEPNGRHSSKTRYFSAAYFVYEVDGQSYQSIPTIYPQQGGSQSLGRALSAAQRLELGKTATLRVADGNPGQVVADNVDDGILWHKWGFTLFLGLFMLLCFASAPWVGLVMAVGWAVYSVLSLQGALNERSRALSEVEATVLITIANEADDLERQQFQEVPTEEIRLVGLVLEKLGRPDSVLIQDNDSEKIIGVHYHCEPDPFTSWRYPIPLERELKHRGVSFSDEI